MLIGIYSGTFDPIHEGHVLFASVAMEQFGLDKIVLMPERKPRGKKNVSDVDLRESMALLATTSYPGGMDVLITDEPSHTLNGSLSEIYKQYPDDDYFIIMGADVFEHIGEWDSEGNGVLAEIADKIGFIVGVESVAQADELKLLSDQLNLNVRFIEVPLKGVSSRKIREKISRGDQPHGLSDEVLDFIKLKELYVE